MERFLVIFALTLCVLLMTAEVNVRADEDDNEEQDTGWFAGLLLVLVDIRRD